MVLLIRKLKEVYRITKKPSTLILESAVIEMFRDDLEDLNPSCIVQAYDESRLNRVQVKDDLRVERLSGGDPEEMLDEEKQD